MGGWGIPISTGRGSTELIHSVDYYQEVRGTAIRFMEHAKETAGVKNIWELKPEHTRNYLKHLGSTGASKGYLVNVESYLKKFQTAAGKFCENIGKEPSAFFEGRKYSAKERERPVNRSYTPDEVRQLAKHMSPQVRDGMEMAVNLGFRTKTIANIRAEHIVRHEDGRLEVRIDDGRGITKGGRFLGRGPDGNHPPFFVPAAYVPHLERLLHGKKLHEKILPVKESTLRSGLARACKKTGIKSRGFHGFRHTFARNRLDELLGDRKEAGRELIGRMLKNKAEGRRIEAGVPLRWKQEGTSDAPPLYRFVLDCIDQVHVGLGHGESRWELMEVYMS
jgi:integrase/recombinase XerD